MCVDVNTTNIIIAAIAAIGTACSGALIGIKINKNRSNSARMDNIKVKGKKNKVFGGDDNSFS